jgi:hypothetical protein
LEHELDASLDPRYRRLARRIAQRLLALTLSILVNTILGRPPRATAASDGR